jgi:hypothetical protein
MLQAQAASSRCKLKMQAQAASSHCRLKLQAQAAGSALISSCKLKLQAQAQVQAHTASCMLQAHDPTQKGKLKLHAASFKLKPFLILQVADSSCKLKLLLEPVFASSDCNHASFKLNVQAYDWVQARRSTSQFMLLAQAATWPVSACCKLQAASCKLKSLCC